MFRCSRVSICIIQAIIYFDQSEVRSILHHTPSRQLLKRPTSTISYRGPALKNFIHLERYTLNISIKPHIFIRMASARAPLPRYTSTNSTTTCTSTTSSRSSIRSFSSITASITSMKSSFDNYMSQPYNNPAPTPSASLKARDSIARGYERMRRGKTAERREGAVQELEYGTKDNEWLRRESEATLV